MLENDNKRGEKNAYIFCFTSWLVLRHLPLVRQDLPDPLGHRVGQAEEVAVGHVRHPHRLDRRDELGQGGGGVPFSLQLPLHLGPAVLNGV